MKRKIYEVMPDRIQGGWKVVSNGTCLKRTATQLEAIKAGSLRARNRASDPDFGSDATLRIRNASGQFGDERNYKFSPDNNRFGI